MPYPTPFLHAAKRASVLLTAAAVLAPCAAAQAQHATEYTYDALGRLTKVDRERRSCSSDRTTLYNWDDASNRERIRVVQGDCKNDPPGASNDYVSVRDTYSRVFTPLSNDLDPNFDELYIESVGQCGGGCVVTRVSPTQLSIMGTRVGQFTFTYTISDRRDGTDTARVYVNVHERNSSPEEDPW